jgi:hypothetical protein
MSMLNLYFQNKSDTEFATIDSEELVRLLIGFILSKENPSFIFYLQSVRFPYLTYAEEVAVYHDMISYTGGPFTICA